MSRLELVPISLPVIPQPEFYLSGFDSDSTFTIPSNLSRSDDDIPKSPRIITPSEEESKHTRSLPEHPRIIIKRNLKESNGILKFPTTKTIVPHVPPEALVINKDQTALALAYTSRQNILQVLEDIDERKLISGRASDNSIYSLDQVKEFAKRLGLKTSKPKDTLISEIKQIISDFKTKS